MVFLENNSFNKLLFHPSFSKTVNEINNLNIQLPPAPTKQDLDFNSYNFPPDGVLAEVEKFGKFSLNPIKGQELLENLTICAYDESINKFSGLEGTAFLTSHSLVLIHKDDDYIPSNLLTFYFYTRSKKIVENSEFIKYSQDPETDSKHDYARDRTDFIISNVPKNSIIFIDGPLIGGQMNSYTIRLNEELLKRNVIPIFFVKNSTSNLVTDNLESVKGKFNSDIHWAFNTLRQGERTSFFRYIDKFNERNGKIFCYLKTFNLSPQRIEFHVDTFEKYKEKIPQLMDLIQYLLLVQGDLRNPQIRPIAISEKYARDTLKLINFNTLMKNSGLVPTMNQERFGW